jgi:alpha-galactosidase
MTINYDSIAKHCNLWRNYNDIEFSWGSVLGIIDFYAQNQVMFSKINGKYSLKPIEILKKSGGNSFRRHSGPGQWFDPDMIIVGNNGLSIEQQEAQFAIWAMLSAPLLMSNDLRTVSQESKAILKNRHVIAIDQDQYGLFGQRVFKKNAFEIWLKPCDPQNISGINHWSYAIVYFNRATLGIPKIVSFFSILDKLRIS